MRTILFCMMASFSFCAAHDAAIVPDRAALDAIKKINEKDENENKKLVVTFDLNKVNSSTEKTAVRFEGIEESIGALEQQLAALSSQLLALKMHVKETKKVAYEQAEIEKRQTASLENRLKETEEKLTQSQKIVIDQQMRLQHLVVATESVVTGTI